MTKYKKRSVEKQPVSKLSAVSKLFYTGDEMHPRSCGFLHCVNIMCCTIKQRTAFYTVCNCSGHPLTKSTKPCGTKGMDQGVWITLLCVVWIGVWIKGMDRGMDRLWARGLDPYSTF